MQPHMALAQLLLRATSGFTAIHAVNKRGDMAIDLLQISPDHDRLDRVLHLIDCDLDEQQQQQQRDVASISLAPTGRLDHFVRTTVCRDEPRFLTTLGPPIVTARDNEGRTLLHVACYNRNVAATTVQAMLDEVACAPGGGGGGGGAAAAAAAVDEEGSRLLHASNNNMMWELLTAKDITGATPLHAAFSKYRKCPEIMTIVEAILNAADRVETAQGGGTTCSGLLVAIHQDTTGDTALHKAAALDDGEHLCQQLLHVVATQGIRVSGAGQYTIIIAGRAVVQVVRMRNHKHETAVHVAARAGRGECIGVMVRAMVSMRMVDAVERAGAGGLVGERQRCALEVAGLMRSEDGAGMTPLHHAIMASVGGDGGMMAWFARARSAQSVEAVLQPMMGVDGGGSERYEGGGDVNQGCGRRVAKP